MVKNLNTLRNKIDCQDAELMNILYSRFKIVRKIGKFKKDNNLRPHDKKRQKEVLKMRIRQGKSKGLNPKFVEKLYNLIFKEAIAVQGEK